MCSCCCAHVARHKKTPAVQRLVDRPALDAGEAHPSDYILSRLPATRKPPTSEGFPNVLPTGHFALSSYRCGSSLPPAMAGRTGSGQAGQRTDLEPSNKNDGRLRDDPSRVQQDRARALGRAPRFLQPATSFFVPARKSCLARKVGNPQLGQNDLIAKLGQNDQASYVANQWVGQDDQP